MITENEVVGMVSLKLKELNFGIISSCSTKEKGIDIVATRRDKKLFIEAKGGTSSIKSSRAGKPFNRSQARTHISVAIFKLLQLREENKDELLGIALPYDKNHYEFIQSIKSSLQDLKITIFWCSEKNVIIENNDLDKGI
jgi:hypothetical protein